MIKTCSEDSVGMSVLSEMLMAQIRPSAIHKGLAVTLMPRWPMRHGDLHALEVALKLLGVQMPSGPDEYPVKDSSISSKDSRMRPVGLSERDLNRVDTMHCHLFCSLVFPPRWTLHFSRGKSLHLRKARQQC